MDEAEQKKACRTAKLFSRVEPSHKSKIVDYLQKDGAVSAMVRRGLGREFAALENPVVRSTTLFNKVFFLIFSYGSYKWE